MAGPLADFVVSLNIDGHITSQGSIPDALAEDPKLAEEVKHEEEAVELDEHEEAITTKPADDKKGKLVVAEEIAVGHVSWSACECYLWIIADESDGVLSSQVQLLLNGLGGKWPTLFWTQYLGGVSLAEVGDILETWWLGYWARQYALTDPANVSIK